MCMCGCVWGVWGVCGGVCVCVGGGFTWCFGVLIRKIMAIKGLMIKV